MSRSTTPVLDLLSDASKWTQNASARDAQGKSVHPTAIEAVCWCVIGAVAKCYPEITSQSKAMLRLMAACPGGVVVGFNCNPVRKFEEVREVIIKAQI